MLHVGYKANYKRAFAYLTYLVAKNCHRGGRYLLCVLNNIY